MNTNIEYTNEQQKSLSLSERLAQLRTQKNLTTGDVARYLCLNEKIIENIESGRNPNMLKDVFFRGYIRSYAKLVSMPEDELRDFLGVSQHVEVAEDPVVKRDYQPTFAALKSRCIALWSDKKNRRIVMGVLAGLILLYTFFSGNKEATSPLPVDVVDERPVIEDDFSPIIDNEYLLMMQNSNGNDVDDDMAGGDVLGDFIRDKVVLQEEPEPALSTQPATAAQPTSPPNQTSTATAVDAQAALAGKKQLGVLLVQCNEDCWLKVTDLNDNNVLFIGTKRKGDSLSFNQLTKYQVILGNAQATTLKFNNQPINLIPFIRQNNAAQLTLNATNLLLNGLGNE